MRSIIFVIFGLITFGFASCHFGDSAEEMLDKYSNTERDLIFTFGAEVPGGSSTRVVGTDEGLDGVSSKWRGDESIALFDFGNVFITTNGGGTSALALKYKKKEDPEFGIDFAKFEGTGRTKISDAEIKGKTFALAYPYNKFDDKPCSSSSLDLSFNPQTGKLQDLYEYNHYAWGYTTGICKDDEITLYEYQASCSSDLPWHSHTAGTERIVLDNKMSIIRFSMIYGLVNIHDDNSIDTTWMTLNDYLSRNNWKIDHIDVSNLESASYGIDRAELDLRTGQVLPKQDADSVIRVQNLSNAPLVLMDIAEGDATPVSHETGAEKVSWGTTFYLSVPCHYKRLNIQPLLTIYTIDEVGNPAETYYGLVSTKELKEGDYYMTAPIKLVDNRVKLQEEAKIYLYYHSSFVWGDSDPIEI